MHFFTPELYLQYNSSDDEEADRADAAWEEAISRYEEHLDSIRDKLPSQVRMLAELQLHDADILSRAEEIISGGPLFYAGFPFPSPFWSAVGILTLKHEGKFLSLIYCLSDRIRQHASQDDWSFSRDREHWLYDELDIAPGGRGPFVHRILLSSGVVLEIPFFSVVVHEFSPPRERDEPTLEETRT